MGTQTQTNRVYGFSYLCYYQSHNQLDDLTLEIIANGIRSTTNKAKKHIESFISKGLITSDWSLVPNLQCRRGRNFFKLPNEIFLLNLPPSVFMVYAYLLLIEDRKTHTCHPSYKIIGRAVGMSINTVQKYIAVLGEKGFIGIKNTSVITKSGQKRNGTLRYTIHPIQDVIDLYHQRQL